MTRKISKPSSWIRYIMIVTLIIVIAFTLYYVYDLNRSMRDMETFVQSSNDKIKVIFIYSKSCGYCTQFKPVFDSTMASLQLPNEQVSVEKFESSDPRAAPFSGILQGVPFVIVQKNGKVVASKAGMMQQTEFTAWLKPFLQ